MTDPVDGAVTVYAPGSVSNLGPGFDCLGIAFTGRGDRVTVRRTDAPGVRVTAVSDPRIPTDAALNTAAIAAAAVLAQAGGDGGLELTIEKGLPLAAGMGGSAASAVAGAVAADAVLGSHLHRMDLMAAALEGEAVVSGRHPQRPPSCGARSDRQPDPKYVTRCDHRTCLAWLRRQTVETSLARAGSRRRWRATTPWDRPRGWPVSWPGWSGATPTSSGRR